LKFIFEIYNFVNPLYVISIKCQFIQKIKIDFRALNCIKVQTNNYFNRWSRWHWMLNIKEFI